MQRKSKKVGGHSSPLTQASQDKDTGDAVTNGTITEKHLGSATFLGIKEILPFPYARLITRMFLFGFIVVFIFRAYTLRTLSIEQYGYLIHEFDPWFNYRATEYLSDHGWDAFFSWFDYMSWYPLGRPVGSTIYPGLQITSVALHRAINALGYSISLNDVCVLLPAWFAAFATFILGLMAYEVSGSIAAVSLSCFAFALAPAHTMRSMAGEYDNECIAMAAMLLTFYLWIRSLRTPRSWPIGLLAGLAYGYMVAAWGGYIFVLNMVALHAGVSAMLDWVRNTYEPSLLKSYALFFIIGTAIATRVPPVGMSPFKSLEQLSALLVFIFLCSLHVAEVLRRRAGVSDVLSRDNFRIRNRVFAGVAAGLMVFALVIAPTGYFGPLSSRVRALFVAHTRTGNPLVDSVAEHQPGNSQSYIRYLGVVYPLWMFGSMALPVLPSPNVRAVSFFFLYSIAAFYFCAKMARLMLLAGPVACVCAGSLVGVVMQWCFMQFFWDQDGVTADRIEAHLDGTELIDDEKGAKGRKKRQHHGNHGNAKREDASTGFSALIPIRIRSVLCMSQWPSARMSLCAIFVAVFVMLIPVAIGFASNGRDMAHALSSPRIVFKAQYTDGSVRVIDDYLKAYQWLKENTPQDARILSWWDYGYQITGIGNRTTLADGNTWNHEHIATIGKMLTSPVDEAHSIVRHMADYVLIWAGRAGDLMKSPHMARIGNSVYRDICPNDPLCAHFGFYSNDHSQPTPTMRNSLLFNLHENGNHGVTVDRSLFREVYKSANSLVRIYKVLDVSEESKKWIEDPANRVCNPSGSWICPGQYPPAPEVQAMLAKRVDFGQLEDFNRKKKDDAYYKEYMKRSQRSR